LDRAAVAVDVERRVRGGLRGIMRQLKSKAGRPERDVALGKRIEVALARHECGEPLTENEWTIVQYTLGGGCRACGGSGYRGVRVVVRSP
jgi:hypothetical protein